MSSAARTNEAPASLEAETSYDSSNHPGNSDITPTTQLDPSDKITAITTTRLHDEKAPDQRTRFLEAVKSGRDDEVQALLGNGNGAIAKKDMNDALREASARGYLRITKILIGAAADVHGGPTMCEKHTSERRDTFMDYWKLDTCEEKACGKTALQAAAEGGHTEIMSILLNAGAKVNAPPSQCSGRTALQAAAGGGHTKIVSILMNAGAKVDAPPSQYSGRTALQAAAGGGHTEILSILLNAGANVDAPPSDSGRTALQAAAEGGHTEIVSILLNARANVDAPPSEYSGKTALQAAAGGGHTEIVSILLNAGANVDEPPSGSGRTALQAAAEGGHTEIVSILLKAGAKVDAPPSGSGRTALQAAAGGGHTEILSILLNAGANVDAPPSDSGRTALQAAAEGGHTEIVSILLNAGAKVDAPPSDSGRTALQAAAEGGHTEIVSILLNVGANVDAPSSEYSGRTALQAAAEGGHTEIVSILLKAGAKVDAPPSEYSGRTALQAAAEGGHTEIVSILLKADANTKTGQGGTALKMAVEGGHTDTVLALLGAGVDINARDKRGQTCLSWGISHPNLVQVLLNKGADIHLQALDGATPLHFAVKELHGVSAGILLNAGANTELKDYESRKPLDIALGLEPSSASFNLVKLLLEHGCNLSARKMGDWRTTIEANEKDTVIITETLVPLAPLPPGSNSGATTERSGDDPVKTISSFKIDMIKGSQESPIFEVSCDPGPLNARRLFSTSRDEILLRRGKKLIKPKFSREKKKTNSSLEDAVTEWQWILLDGELVATGYGLSTVGNLAATIDKQLFLGCYINFKFLEKVPGAKSKDTSHTWSIAFLGRCINFKLPTKALDTKSKDTPHTLGNGFQTKGRRSKIFWIMRKLCIDPGQSNPRNISNSSSNPIFRSEDFRGTLDVGWIPNNGLEFLILFILDLRKKWEDLLEEADLHLDRNRKILLKKKGKTTNFIDNLLLGAQNWSDFRALFQIHVRKAKDMLRDFKERRYLSEEVVNREMAIETLMGIIGKMEKEIGKAIDELGEKTEDMIELEFNLVSIYEARTSKTMGMSMKRLSWITFVFLPLMFVTSLFGMNVDIINGSTPRWWTVIVLSVALFAVVILSWALWRSDWITIGRVEESEDDNSARSFEDSENDNSTGSFEEFEDDNSTGIFEESEDDNSAGRLRAFPGRLTRFGRRWRNRVGRKLKRPTDLESGGANMFEFKSPPAKLKDF